MKNLTVIVLVCILFYNAHGQDIDPDLLIIKHQLEGVIEAKARATLELDVSFINIPKKTADLHFRKGKPISYTSDNFIIIPKRGLDFSWNELFKYKFMTVDRGTTVIQGETLKVLNVIPLDKKADFAIGKGIFTKQDYRDFCGEGGYYELPNASEVDKFRKFIITPEAIIQSNKLEVLLNNVL